MQGLWIKQHGEPGNSIQLLRLIFPGGDIPAIPLHKSPQMHTFFGLSSLPLDVPCLIGSDETIQDHCLDGFVAQCKVVTRQRASHFVWLGGGSRPRPLNYPLETFTLASQN